MEVKQSNVQQQAKQVARTTHDFVVKQYSKTRTKTFFSKLGSSLGLVVTVLPFAGLLLALGGFAISKGSTNNSVLTLGLILANLGNAAYANLGLLFMIAIVMGFTGNKALAVYSSLIGYIAFVGFTLPFIRYDTSSASLPVGPDGSLSQLTHGWLVGQASDPFAVPEKFNIWFWHGLKTATQLDNVLGLKQGTMIPALTSNPNGFARFSYQGIKTLNTGVLGGIALGFLYAWIFNKTKNLKLPNILSFFEGEKFTSVILLLTAPIVAALFIIVWPGVNWLLSEIGVGLTNLPYGIDTLLYEMILQALLPFQAHQAFIAPMWYTSAGGMLSDKEVQIVEAMLYRMATGNTAGPTKELNFYADSITPWMNQIHAATGFDINNYLTGVITAGKTFTGDDVFKALQDGLGNNFNSIFTHTTPEDLKQTLEAYGSMDWSTVGDETISVQLMAIPRFDLRDPWSVNKKISRFLSGGFTQQLFFLPGAAVAMWSTLDKQRRKEKFGLYFGAILSAVVFGVSEPIFFMFAYTCPIVYFTYLVPTAGILGWTCEILQTRLSSTFSRGTMDYVINGILPTFTKASEGAQQTNLWVPIAVGSAVCIPTCLLWRLQFIKYQFAAPGSLAAESGQVGNARYDTIKTNYDDFVHFLGGKNNIKEAEYENKTTVRIVVNKASEVLPNNEFSKDNISRIEQNDNVFIFHFINKPNNDLEWLRYVPDVVQLKTREKAYKQDTLKESKDKRDLSLWKRKYEVDHRIDAKWQVKTDKLEQSNKVELFKYQYKTQLWNNKHLEDIQKLKANYKVDKQLIKANQLDNMSLSELNTEYRANLAKLQVNKELIAKQKTDYKPMLKKVKQEQKQAFQQQKKQ